MPVATLVFMGSGAMSSLDKSKLASENSEEEMLLDVVIARLWDLNHGAFFKCEEKRLLRVIIENYQIMIEG